MASLCFSATKTCGASDRAATLKKQFINIENQYEYKGKETWWPPKVGELSETYQMFSGNVYRERLHLYPIQSGTGRIVCQ